MENKTPNRLDEALSKLGAAVEALENAGSGFAETLRARGYGDEVERLSAELAAVRSDYEALQLTSQHASGRIDAAIGRLKAALES